MADTSVATGDAETAEQWARDLIMEAMKEAYWPRFMGKGPNNIIQVKTELEKSPGDKITFSLGMKLAGAGGSGDSMLEGNEEALQHYSDQVIIDQQRNAVRLEGKMTELRPAFDLRDHAKEALKIWLAEKIDQDIFDDLDGSPTRVLYQSTATSTATITSTMYFNLDIVSKSRTLSLKLAPKIMPLKISGREHHVLVMAPDCEFDLVNSDTEWRTSVRDAQTRGDQNPVFTGMLGLTMGTILHVHENISVTTNWGSGANVNGANNLFVGRQAGCFAWGKRPFWREKEFDYGNKTGFAVGAIYGHTKAVFNSEDHALIAVRTSRTNVAEQS